MTPDLTNPEYLAAEQMLKQREALANMLTQRSMQGVQSVRQGVPASPTQGFAQLAEALVARRKMNEVERGRVELGRKYGDWLDQGAKNYMDSGQYAQPNLTFPGEANAGEDPMQRIRQGLLNRNPLVQRLAAMDYSRQNMLDAPKDVGPGHTIAYPGGHRPNISAPGLHVIPDNWEASLPAGAKRLPNDPKGVFRMAGGDGVLEPYQMEFEAGQLKGAKRLDNTASGSVPNGRGEYYSFIPGQNGRILVGNHRTGTLAEGQLPAGSSVPPVAGAKDPKTTGDNAAAGAAGKEAGEAIAQARLKLQPLENATKLGLTLIDRMIGSEDGKTKPHKGFGSYVGFTLRPGARLIDGTPEADFESILKQQLGGNFLQAYETLKGGGQITVIEGEKATAAINRMSKAQSEAEFMAAAKDARKVMRDVLEAAKARAALPVPGQNQPAQPSIEDLVKKYTNG